MSDANDANQNDQSDDQQDDGENLDAIKGALTKERDARKAAEKSAKDLEKRLAALEGGSKSEAERLTAQLQAAQTRIRDSEGRDAARTAAKRAGAADADIVYRFIKSDIEFDSDGSPTNVDALIADAKQTAPQLFKAAPSRVDGGAGNGAKAGKFDMNARIRQAAGYGSS